MITSGLVNQRRGGGFQNGYPHELPPKSEFIRPYVSVVDKTILEPSSISNPMQYSNIIPSPVVYNDVFGKKATPDERLYILRQIQQGLSTAQPLGVRPVEPTPTIPPNASQSGRPLPPLPPMAPTVPPKAPTVPADQPDASVPTLPGTFPAEEFRVPEARVTPQAAPVLDDLDQELLAAEVVEPLTPTTSSTTRAKDLLNWIHMPDVSFPHFNRYVPDLSFLKNAIGGVPDVHDFEGDEEGYVEEPDQGDPYKYSGPQYRNEMREARPGVHPIHLNGFRKSRQGVPPE